MKGFEAAEHSATHVKAVFLDFGTLGPDSVDPSPLYDVLPGIELHDHTAEDDVAGRIGNAEFVLTNKIRLEAPRLEAAKSLRYIGLAATGSDNVDKDYARRHGIAITNIRGYCTQSVVEHVLGVLFTLTHNLHRYRRDVEAGAWQAGTHFSLLSHPLRELSSMTIGIVGYGELGAAVARAAGQFGMQVLVSRRAGRDQDTRSGRIPFEQLLGLSDVVSLHCPLTDATRGLFTADTFRLMKDDSILINTARGGLVDSDALVAALRCGDIAAAAIDVLAEEPPRGGDPLLEYRGDNLLVTPHIAWASREARQQAVIELAANVRAFRDGDSRCRIV